MDEGRLNRYLNKYVKHNASETVYKYIVPFGSETAKMYGTIKVQKNNTPARPIVSTIGSHNYKLARYLDNIIKPHINARYYVKFHISVH